MPRPLRIGLFLDDTTVSFWQAKVIRQVLECPDLHLALVVMNTGPKIVPARQSFLQKVFKGHSLWWRFSAWDQRKARQHMADVDDQDLAPQLAGVPVMPVVPVARAFEHRFNEADVATLKGWDLDIILRFGFGILRGPVLGAARFGVWSWHHGDNARYRGGPPGFWEVVEKNPVTGVILQVLTEELDAGQVIARTWVHTAPVSPTLNRLGIGQAGVRLFGDGISRALAAEDATSFLQQLTASPRSSAPIYRKPTNVQMARWLLTQALPGWVRRRLQRRTAKQWNIGVARWSPAQLVAQGLPPRFEWYVPAPHHFLADPFLWSHPELGTWAFVEEFPYAAAKAHISAMKLHDDGRLEAPVTVLDCPWHLSFPFLFEWNGDLWMLPEQSTTRRLQLYRCRTFPGEWEAGPVLMEDVSAVDAVVFPHEGRWWLLYTNHDDGRWCNNLYCCAADSPLGPWLPHPAGPVANHPAHARMAGSVIKVEGKLFRPTQDATVTYGGSVRLMAVQPLSADEYAEVEHTHWLPTRERFGRCCHAFHTINFNQSGDWMIVDGQAHLPSP